MSKNLDCRMYPPYRATSAVMNPSPPQPEWMADLLGVPTCCCKVCEKCVCNFPCNPRPLESRGPTNLKFVHIN